MTVVALPFLEQVPEDGVPTASTGKAWRSKVLHVFNRRSELLALASSCCAQSMVCCVVSTIPKHTISRFDSLPSDLR